MNLSNFGYRLIFKKGKFMNNLDQYLVYGKLLLKETKSPLAGCLVEAYDKDLLFDDRLGSSMSNEKGEFYSHQESIGGKVEKS